MLFRSLILDDEPDIVEMVKLAMEALGGYQVATCLTSEDARQALLAGPVDLAIIDLNLEKENGLQFLQWFRRDHPAVPVAILTGLDPEAVQPKLAELRVLEIIAKPLTIPQIQQRIQAIVAKFPKPGRR